MMKSSNTRLLIAAVTFIISGFSLTANAQGTPSTNEKDTVTNSIKSQQTSSYSDVGSPLTKVYTAKQHGGHNQNWTSIQTADGLIYVGHTTGISQWDGENWQNLTTPHSTPVRTFVKFKGNLYFGTTNNLFKLYVNVAGELRTQSLLTLLPNIGEFGDVWSSAANAHGVVFTSAEQTFFYDGETLSKIEGVISSKHGIFSVNDDFYFKPRHLPNLYKLVITKVDGRIEYEQVKMPFEFEPNARVMEVLEGSNGKLTIFTERHGAFQIIDNQLRQLIAAEEFAEGVQVYDAILSSDGFYYVSSTYSGLFILDSNFKIVRQYKEADGISMDTVFSVSEDVQGNIWLAGIPNIVKMRPPHIISEFKAGNASTEILRIKNTSMGMFITGNGQFKLTLPGGAETPAFKALSDDIDSSVDLIQYDDTLIRSGRDGIYELSLNESHSAVVSEKMLIKAALGRILTRDANDHLLVSASNGAFLLKKQNGIWESSSFPASSNQLISLLRDRDDILWLGSATSELFKFDNISKDGISAQRQAFSEADGLGMGPVDIFEIDGRAIFSSAGKLLSYEQEMLQKADLPMLSSEWLADSKQIDNLIQTPAIGSNPERIWYRKNARSGYFEKTDSGQWIEKTAIFDSVEAGGFNDLLVTTDDILWFVRDKDKIYRVNIELAQKLPTISPINIRRMVSKVRSTAGTKGVSENLFIDFRLDNNTLLELQPQQTDIRVSYASTDSSSPAATLYRTRLVDGNESLWSNWSQETYRDFTQLLPGHYKFEVQAMDTWARVSSAYIDFKVIAPWYLTKIAYVLYLMLFLLITFTVAYYVQKWRTVALEAANRDLEEKVITRTKEVNEKVEQLRQQQILKDRFFGNVSHEFRTPLTLTIGPLETLFTEHQSELSAPVSHLAKTALNNASKMLALVGQVLDLNRLEAGKLPLRIAQYDIAELLRNISERFETWAQQHSQLIQVRHCEEPLLLWFDMDQFDKCVSNLLSNAIKYSGKGSIIRISLHKEANSAEVHVSDNGVGISAGAKEKVFERFYQDKSSESVSEPGTGIGLALVREIMEMHHGDVRLTDNIRQGCCFVLSLHKGNSHFEKEQIIEPISVPALTRSANHEDNTDGSSASNPFQPAAHVSFAVGQDEDVTTLLVVDDNEELLNFISLRLSASYRILQARNGQEGYTKACDELPDLIVSDVNMPIMTGLELAQKIKSNIKTQTIPIILLTAKATKREIVEGFSVGADDYLTKPFDTSELIMRVNAQINSRKLIRETLQLAQAKVLETAKPQSFPQKIEVMIEQQLSEPVFNVEQLAIALHMSRDTLIRKCKKECGDTPLNLIVQKRMQKADELLHEKTTSVSEVAYACGFESLAYFSKSYKKHRGISPSEVASQ
ncbi:MAG: signal transduction histidine kinase/DNA-binding response OmpR family regulator [Glaciecola sp.]|jgi:signal transduction histidine kinase/DNA-binding response OmpR family regulator